MHHVARKTDFEVIVIDQCKRKWKRKRENDMQENKNNKFKSADIFHLCVIFVTHNSQPGWSFSFCTHFSLSFSHSIGHSIHLNPLQNIKMYLRISIRLTKSMYNFFPSLLHHPCHGAHKLLLSKHNKREKKKKKKNEKRRYCSIWYKIPRNRRTTGIHGQNFAYHIWLIVKIHFASHRTSFTGPNLKKNINQNKRKWKFIRFMRFICFVLFCFVASLFLSLASLIQNIFFCSNICMQFQRERDRPSHMCAWYGQNIGNIQSRYWQPRLIDAKNECFFLFFYSHKRIVDDVSIATARVKCGDRERTNREIGISFIFFLLQLNRWGFLFAYASTFIWLRLAIWPMCVCAPRLPVYII